MEIGTERNAGVGGQGKKKPFEGRGPFWLVEGGKQEWADPSKELEAFLEKEELGSEALEALNQLIAEHRGEPGVLIPVLQKAQPIVGYLPPVVQKHIAAGLNLRPADVASVVTFYSFFSEVPRGRHLIRVCLGTACYVSGGNRIVRYLQRELGVAVGERTKDRRFTLDTVRCLGCCSLAPVMVVGEDVHQQLESRKALEVLDSYE